MIIESIFSIFFSFAHFLISLLPHNVSSGFGVYSVIHFISALKPVFFLFPVGFIRSFSACVSFWLSTHFFFAILEFIYKKIPGVD